MQASRISILLMTLSFTATVSVACKPTAEAPPKTTQTAELRLAEGWRRLDPAKVTGQAAGKLAVAQEAMKTLGGTLSSTLKSAVGKERDFEQGIKACQQAAPGIARTVSERYSAEVGRTSFKVRNPDNQPRPWAQPIVEQRHDQPVFLSGPGGKYAFMAPIRLGEVCVACHGNADQIPEGVKTTLAALYPEDEAVGFAPGDLRGWFWVEFSGPGG